MLIKADPFQIQSYLEDSSSLKGAITPEIVFPENAEEASAYLKKRNAKKLPVTIQGGHTATTGSGLPFGESVISTERLTTFGRILLQRNISQSVIKVESGVLLKDLQQAVNDEEFLYPPDSTEQTATIGGNIATNASGARSFSYGSTRDYVQGLTIVLADGSIDTLERGMITAKKDLFDFSWAGKRFKFARPNYTMPATKNAAGYFSAPNMDLIDLFIGMEGTLGFVVEAKLKLVDLPADPFDCVAFFRSEEEGQNFLMAAKALKPISLEYMGENALNLLRPKNKNVPNWSKSAVLWEQATARDALPGTSEELLGRWADLLKDHNSSLDQVWYAETPNEIQKIKDFRHGLPEAVNKLFQQSGFTKVSTDLAVPEPKIKEMLAYYKTELEKCGLPNVSFGHLGQNHLHVNLFSKNEKEYETSRKLALTFAKKAVSLGGTVSAEHGIGKIKHDFLKLMYGDAGINEMRRIKAVFDPFGILNPGNLFPKA